MCKIVSNIKVSLILALCFQWFYYKLFVSFNLKINFIRIVVNIDNVSLSDVVFKMMMMILTDFMKWLTKENNKPLRVNPTKWSNTLKQFVGKNWRIVWVCLSEYFSGLAPKGLSLIFSREEALSEVLTIANFRHVASRIWTCVEPEFWLF